MNLMTIMLQAEAAPKGNNTMFLVFMVLIFVVMWFLLIRPQQKRQKEAMKFRESLQKGMKVVTAGGIYGTIKEVKETYVLLEVDSATAIRVDKSMIVKDNSELAQQK